MLDGVDDGVDGSSKNWEKRSKFSLARVIRALSLVG